VKLAIKIAAVGGGALTALVIGGYGARAADVSGTASGGSPASVRACAAYGVHAIEHHITVTWKPAPCQGLSKAEVNQAVAMAVLRVTGDAPKALRRKREAEAAPYLYYLVTTPPRAAGSRPTFPTSPPPGRGKDLPMSVAALIAWLVTAGSGAYVLGSWIARGGSLRRHAGGASTSSPPSVIFGHFGLALSGLAVWVAYLITGWAVLAWAAVGVLLPVAGLGMATLAVGLPRRRPPVTGGALAGAADQGTGSAAAATARADGIPPLAGDGTSGSPRTAVIGPGGAGPGGVGGVGAGRAGMHGTATDSVRTRLSPLVVAGHGALAVTTMLLVLLAALGGAAN
jgi:hypothetical protein